MIGRQKAAAAAAAAEIEREIERMSVRTGVSDTPLCLKVVVVGDSFVGTDSFLTHVHSELSTQTAHPPTKESCSNLRVIVNACRKVKVCPAPDTIRI